MASGIYMTILTLNTTGWGKDFFVCLILTLLGWIPGVHSINLYLHRLVTSGQIYNFYIQNIRDNTKKERTPRFAIKYKLVDVDKYRKRQQKNAWRQRYEGGIDSAGIFDSRSSVSSESSAKHFDLPFNTGSGPIDSRNSSFVNDLQAASRAPNRTFGSLFKGTFGKSRKDPNRKKDRWERSRISRVQSQMIEPDDETEGPEEPEEPVGLYSSARSSRDVPLEDDGSLATDLRHE